MKRSDKNATAEIRTQSSEWFVRLSSADLSDSDRAGFQRWMAADPLHQQAYERIEQLSNNISQCDRLAEAGVEASFARLREALGQPAEPEQKQKQKQKQERPWWLDWQALKTRWRFAPQVLSAALLMVMVISLSLLNPMWQTDSQPLVYTTHTGEIRDIRLADGSVVTLSPVSQLNVAFSDEVRHTALIKGQAFFAIASNRQRPFVVLSNNTHIEVLGTQFNVRHSAKATRVVVAEGRVAVTHSKPDPAGTEPATVQQQILTKNQTVTGLTQGALSAVKTVDAGQASAWRKGHLLFEDATLQEIVDDLNRYYPGRIRINSPNIGDHRVTIGFNSQEIKQAVNDLSLVLPIKVITSGEDIVLIAQ